MFLIIYTTKYRKGGEEFRRVADTLKARLISSENAEVICEAVDSKMDLRKLFYEIKKEGKLISEFHFIGHAGMYGPMFGSISFPEQFSPWEWEQLEIPFAKDAKAFFRCCRSARWFAPFFARTFQVKSYGFFWYTCFSKNENYLRTENIFGRGGNLFCFGCPGRKSHGLLGSLKKYSGFMKAEQMSEFNPEQQQSDLTYNPVSELYNKTFSDIKVREDEWKWILKHLDDRTDYKVLDLGCGNGSLLKELSETLVNGVGVDESDQMIQLAEQNCRGLENITFRRISGPFLPFPDASFNIVISLLSFRYLDWDPIMNELRRVLVPDGKILIIDMVTVPVKYREYFRLLKDKFNLYRQHKKYPEYHDSLKTLVSHPSWKEMLKYNPVRAQHEYKWFLESRFLGRSTEIINIGYRSRILAFDSGPVKDYKEIKLSYP